MAKFTTGNSFRFNPGENRYTRERKHAAKAERSDADLVRVALAGDSELERVSASITVADPVDRARRTLQELAPRLALTVAAIATADVVAMSPWVGPLRVRLDAALQALNRAGLKDTVVLEHDFSDRFKDALAAFYGPPGALEPAAPLALPPDPAEPARRHRDRKAP